MSEVPKELKAWQFLVASLLIGWLGWMSIVLIGLKSQVEFLTNNQRDVIPPSVQNALLEIRQMQRTADEKQFDQISRLMEAALENRKEIGFLKEKVAASGK